MGSTLGWTLVCTALVTSVPAIYYYTRVVIKMIVRQPSDLVNALPDDRPRMIDPQGWTWPHWRFVSPAFYWGSVAVIPFMSLSRETVSPIVRTPAIGSLPITRE